MDDPLLLYELECLSGLTSVPISLYRGDISVETFAPYKVRFDMVIPWLDPGDKDRRLQTVITDELLLLGLVPDEASDRSIVIGPVRTGKVDEERAKRIIASGRPALQDADLQEIMLYLNACPDWSAERFSALMKLVYSMVNGKPAGAEENPTVREVHRAIHSGGDLSEYEDPSADYEKKVLFYVQHGMTASIRQLGNYMGDVPELADTPLRMYKNALIILNSLCQRAAIAGGLEPEISHRIGLGYIRKTEAASSVAELAEINRNMQMAAEYSERVAQIICPESSDPNIQKAIRCIRRNFQKKLTVQEIASHVHLSKEYLSSRFHAETGMTLPKYVATQKVVAAEELLAFTDMSIADIAAFLSFSSQSYFQSVFKKIRGITPLQYRQLHH